MLAFSRLRLSILTLFIRVQCDVSWPAVLAANSRQNDPTSEGRAPLLATAVHMPPTARHRQHLSIHIRSTCCFVRDLEQTISPRSSPGSFTGPKRSLHSRSGVYCNHATSSNLLGYTTITHQRPRAARNSDHVCVEPRKHC